MFWRFFLLFQVFRYHTDSVFFTLTGLKTIRIYLVLYVGKKINSLLYQNLEAFTIDTELCYNHDYKSKKIQSV
jgi:hypothetical protein